MPSFLTPPRPSTTALGAPIDKLCENPSCGRIFQTCEPQRLYCSLRCKDYAARRRRRLKDRLQDEGHDPRAGQTERERNAHHLAAAREASARRDFDLEARIAAEGLRSGKLTPELFRALHPEVLRRLQAAELAALADPSAAPDIVAGGSESVLADLGFIRPAEGPKVDDDEPDEGTLASEL